MVRLKAMVAGIFVAALMGVLVAPASAETTPVGVWVQEGGPGSISSSPAGIDNCRDHCTADFEIGQVVTITATPDPGMGIVSWGGLCDSVYVVLNGNTCTFEIEWGFDYVVNGVRVTFGEVPPNDDFADATDMGSGDVHQGFGSTAGGSHEPDEPMHASPSESASAWLKWKAPAFGDLEANTCSNSTLFDTTLAVYTGTELADLQQVASNDEGDEFVSWCERGTSIVNFAVTKGVTYYFAVDGPDGDSGQYTLDLLLTRTPRPVKISFTGDGKGAVKFSPEDGANCVSTDGDCTTPIGDSLTVTLTPNREKGSLFAGFGGDCSGQGPCTLTVTEAMELTASFVPGPRRDLTVSRSGNGTGSIRLAGPDLPDCRDLSCVQNLPYETDVKLLPVADPGSSFAGWSGACSGSDDCQLTLSEDAAVSAVFTKDLSFKVGKPTINKRKGTARLPVTVNQKAKVKATGSGVKPKSMGLGTAGTIKLPVAAKGKALKSLRKKGKATLRVKVTATLPNGENGSRTVKVKLRKK
ncbi:MAG TPA: hypothetical protein VMF31_07220 [Solirubrobacterales bacterium]|nr:hypothetical protein [Solirubrobacterales bacterium]